MTAALQAQIPKCRPWRWHAAEELEHRAVAFDLYKALGGNYAWRVRWFICSVLLFSLDASRQTVLNLYHDGTLFKSRTLWSAVIFFWGKNGMIWRCARPLLRYLRRDFHPNHESHAEPAQQSHALATRWLADNADSWQAVR